MNIKHMIANAVVRRVVYVLLAAVFAWLGVGGAKAANQYEALQDCQTNMASWLAAAPTQRRNAQCVLQPNRWDLTGETFVGFWSESTVGNYPFTNTCATQPPLTQGWVEQGSGPICYEACAYGGQPGEVSGDVMSVTVNPGTPQEKTLVRQAGGLGPTGLVCSASTGIPSAITQPVCSQVGTLTQCMRPDGKHCATASTGKQFCWTPSENGVKHEGNEGATKSPVTTEVKPPATPPPNGGEWTQTGQGTVTVNNNGNTTTSNVTNWSSNYGNEGTGGGSTNGDGTENGNGTGNGNGDGEGDGNGVGAPTGENLGDLYEPTDKTVESAFQGFWNAAQTTAVFNQINAFFGNCGYGGTCPNLTYENEYMGRLSFTQLCDGTIADILTFGGFVVLAMGAFAGFRIGVY